MTGTSMDALDVALVRIIGRGLDMRAELVAARSRPLDALAIRLRDFAGGSPSGAGDICSMAHDLSTLHIDAMRELLAGARVDRVDLVAVHGQTVFHAPPRSWQMIAPAPIAAALGAPVVSDLRAADLAAGGQGAPITPLADWILFRDAHESRAIANLGGFCNVTLMGPTQPDADLVDAASRAGESPPQGLDSIRGRDLCACNHLLDTIARRVLGVPYDEGGAAALAAEVDSDALDDLLGVLVAQSASKRSLGTGDDDLMSWIGRHRARCSGGTLAATACEAIGQVIARSALTSRLLLAGGGVRNAALVRAITSCCSCRVETTAALGIPPEYREAIAMGVLGALCEDRVPITLSPVTGVTSPPRAGAWIIP